MGKLETCVYNRFIFLEDFQVKKFHKIIALPVCAQRAQNSADKNKPEPFQSYTDSGS